MGLTKRTIVEGVAVHNNLSGRSSADAHPISAITGLQSQITTITNNANSAIATANGAEADANSAVTTATTADGKATQAQTDIGTKASLLTTDKSNLVNAINENFTNASNGKSSIATAITGKGGTADSSMTFGELATAIGDIPNITNSTGDAVEGDVRAAKTFSNDSGVNKTGTLTFSPDPELFSSSVIVTKGTTVFHKTITHNRGKKILSAWGYNGNLTHSKFVYVRNKFHDTSTFPVGSGAGYWEVNTYQNTDSYGIFQMQTSSVSTTQFTIDVSDNSGSGTETQLFMVAVTYDNV